MAMERFDVLIVGAGISGIGGGAHLKMRAPGKSFAILEGRERLGGTWDLFKYPGIRSDSDMHTLGFSFKPWTHEKSIADAGAILDYLNETADEYGLRDHIRFNTMLTAARWDSNEGLWTVTIKSPAGEQQMQAQVLYMCTGYYRYSEGYMPDFAGMDRFKGPIIHPQKWPEDLDYKGKNVVVIGSGATAVTILPAMANNGAGHVTMLQRSPTWYATRPAKDRFANIVRKLLPGKLAYAVTRFKNTNVQQMVYETAQKKPEKVSKHLMKMVQDELGPDYDYQTHFTPRYKPWDQRLCLVPDGDMFKAIKRGDASIVTDEIDSFTETGIHLKSGKDLPADIIISATGLHMEVMHGVALSIDGRAASVGQSFSYKGCMYSGIPNLISAFGYSNASWTLKADLISEYLCRMLDHFDKTGTDYCIPVADGVSEEAEGMMNLSSGYVERAKGRVPMAGNQYPWRAYHNYRIDKKLMRNEPMEDGHLQFRRADHAAHELPIAAE